MCVLLVTFPPSKNFETYLRSFIQQRTTHTEGRVDIMAKHCLRRLALISKKGPRGKAPSLSEIEIASVRIRFLPCYADYLVLTRSYVGCCLQPVYVRRIARCDLQTPRTNLSTPKSPHHPTLPRRRDPCSRRCTTRRHIPCPRRWRPRHGSQIANRQRLLQPRRGGRSSRPCILDQTLVTRTHRSSCTC